MTLAYILVFVVVAAVLGVATRKRGRLPVLLAISALAVYALQPALPVRGLDFWLPTLTLGLTVLGWVLTTPHAATRSGGTTGRQRPSWAGSSWRSA